MFIMSLDSNTLWVQTFKDSLSLRHTQRYFIIQSFWFTIQYFGLRYSIWFKTYKYISVSVALVHFRTQNIMNHIWSLSLHNFAFIQFLLFLFSSFLMFVTFLWLCFSSALTFLHIQIYLFYTKYK